MLARWLDAAGLGVAAGLLLYEHSLVRRDDLSRLDPAFFLMNGVIGLTVSDSRWPSDWYRD